MPAIAHQNKILGNTNSLNDLTDVTITSPTAGQALLFDANGNVVNGDIASEIDDSVTSASKTWSSSKVNSELALKANSADVPTKAQITNPNLLDNPWFTVNQRGQSSYTSVGYTVDRWYSNTAGTVTIGDGYLTIPANGSLKQNLELNRLVDGKTYTFSVMTNDGNIYSMTGVLTTSASSWQLNKNFINNYLWAGIQVGSGGTLWDIRITSANGITIKAVKLELGSISTLALDTAPNYATELLKCQRYFVRFGLANDFSNVGMVIARSASLATGTIPLPVEMRVKPAISGTGYSILRNGIDIYASTGYSIDAYSTSSVMVVVSSNNSFTTGTPYEMFLEQEKYISLTADL